MTTLTKTNSIHRSPWQLGFLLIPLLLACFGLAPMAQAVGPDTDGSIPGSNNGEGVGVLVSRTGGVWNTGTGFEALNHLTAGNQNTATGLRALNSDINGGYNTATGVYSLFSNTSGFFNSATGAYSLANNTTGGNNTANGYGALYSNTEGIDNTANGFAALYKNTTGGSNTADGFQALFSNTTGYGNVACGRLALYSNTTGYQNTAVGANALLSNIDGFWNTAIGVSALFSHTTGGGNAALGNGALLNHTTGYSNTAVGGAALYNNTTGILDTAVGFAASDLTTGDNDIMIGNLGAADESDTIRIGTVTAVTDEFGVFHPAHTATYIAGISGQTAAGGVAVFIDSDGKLGTLTSSARFKTEIKPMDESSEAILALKPVTFRYRHDLDPKGIPQFGLVAEEVEKVNPHLVSRDRDGKPYTVRYEAVNAMLLNEFLKEHRTVQEQQKEIDALRAELKGQRALIQKVSDKVELDKPAPQTVLNNQ